MASSLVLVSAVLLVYCITVCTSHDSGLVVQTTADRLREEIRSQLDEALEESLPELCNGYPQSYVSAAQSSLASDDIISAIITELDKHVPNVSSIEDLVNNTVINLVVDDIINCFRQLVCL